VGNNGETLVADSSTAVGLSYQGNFAAGKNKIINGDFLINQRNFTSVVGPTSTYGFDRWLASFSDGTVTYSAQTFTPGTAPVAGYEGVNFARLLTTGQTLTTAETTLRQRIEDVRTFAGQTATISFWAKAASGTPSVSVEYNQDFGSGGSSRVDTNAGKVAISTSWARYSLTVAIPSVSGKTIGTGSSLGIRFWTSAGSSFNARTSSLGIQNNTIDFWGVQVEAGSVATAFQTATGTIQGELAACQRYYFRTTGQQYTPYAVGTSTTTTTASLYIQYPVPMRIIPSSVEYANLALSDLYFYSLAVSALTFDAGSVGTNIARLNVTNATGATAFRPAFLRNDNNTAGYLGISAEL
jgi:hypothetical protein